MDLRRQSTVGTCVRTVASAMFHVKRQARLHVALHAGDDARRIRRQRGSRQVGGEGSRVNRKTTAASLALRRIARVARGARLSRRVTREELDRRGSLPTVWRATMMPDVSQLRYRAPTSGPELVLGMRADLLATCVRAQSRSAAVGVGNRGVVARGMAPHDHALDPMFHVKRRVGPEVRS